jgi:hypothetical protein
MKQLLTLLLALFAVSCGFSQNANFVPFHTAYDSLYKKLSHIREMTLQEEGQREALIARQLHSEISYRFHQDSIYRIEVKNEYFKRKDAQMSYKGCRAYLHKIGARETAFFWEGKAQHIIAIKAGNAYEITYTEYPKSRFTVALAVKCVRFTPREKLNDYDYMADM